MRINSNSPRSYNFGKKAGLRSCFFIGDEMRFWMRGLLDGGGIRASPFRWFPREDRLNDPK